MGFERERRTYVKKIAIILSGCGFMDGGEIHESVTTLLAVVKAGATPLFFAPDVKQTVVKNHLTKEATNETRNVLVEAARIARGNIKPLSELKASDADALILPGGFGAAMNLSDFGTKGADCKLLPDVERVLLEFHSAKKPIGLICIAPAVGAKVLGKFGVELTIGTDAGTAAALEKLGAKHFNKSSNEIHIDETNKVVSTPAYMLAKNIAEVDAGVSKLVETIIKLTK